MNLSKSLAFVLFLIGLILVVGFYYALEKLPELQREKVAKRLPFTEGAESTEKWKNSKDKGYLKIYLFNITNTEEYLTKEDELIQVQEVGPIVYSYVPNITILNWTNDQNEIKFAKFRTFYLEPEMTKIDLETPINTVDIIASSIVDKLNNYNNIFLRLIASPVVNQNMKKYNTTLFHTKTIDEMLFKGYDISVLAQINSEAAAKYPDNLYGLMRGKNFSNDGIWTMNTGKDNISRLGEIEKWDEVSLNNCWNDPTENCGHVIGSDGTRFHPGLNPAKDKKVNLYSSSLFRSLSMIHKRDYILKGIKVSRYELEEKNFNLKLDENKCYCPDKDKTLNGIPMCDFDGLLDISGCRKAPIIISAPHFLYGDERILDHIKGLYPNLTKHESFIDIDPVTGLVLNGKKRLQINVYVRKHRFGHKNKDTIVPVMWIEEGQEITDEKAVLYYQAIYGLVDKLTYFFIGCIIVGIILIISALVITIINIIRSNDKFFVKHKKADINHNSKYHKAATMPMEEKVKITTTEK